MQNNDVLTTTAKQLLGVLQLDGCAYWEADIKMFLCVFAYKTLQDPDLAKSVTDVVEALQKYTTQDQ